MLSRAMIGIVMMALVVCGAVAQSAPQGQKATNETQTRDVWIDPSTKLMWTAKDNGKDVGYRGAVKYCRHFRLGGHSDWRLPTLKELQGIYDKTANAPGLSGGKAPDMWHVKGNLFLTGLQWGYNESGVINADNYFDFNEGRSNNASAGLWGASTFHRALCVRDSRK